MVGVAEHLGVDEKQVIQLMNPRGVRRAAKPRSDKTKIFLFVSDDAFWDGSKPNMSIGAVTGGNFFYSWRGPMIGLLMSFGSDGTARTFIEDTNAYMDDMTMTDYRDLIDFFASYGQYVRGTDDFGPSSFCRMAPALIEEVRAQRQVRVLTVACDVEQQMWGPGGLKYINVELGEGHPAFAFLRPLPITVSLGFPLVMRRFPTSEAAKKEAGATGLTNHGPGFLLLCTDPFGKDWGKLEEVQGNVVVMRADKKDLHEHHLTALLSYLRRIIWPALIDTHQGKRERAEVVEMVTPWRLNWYFLMLRKETARYEKAWNDTPDLFEGEDNKEVLGELEKMAME
ncbi:MAG: hypothetical protein Q9170_001917 [Blastenia crenularia]